MQSWDPREREHGSAAEALFQLRIRRQADSPPTYTVRFSTTRGAGLLTLDVAQVVKASDLRTNGFLADLTREQVLEGQFVYVGETPGANAKYHIWDSSPEELDALGSSRWVELSARLVDVDPFFVLDTDMLGDRLDVDLPPSAVHEDGTVPEVTDATGEYPRPEPPAPAQEHRQDGGGRLNFPFLAELVPLTPGEPASEWSETEVIEAPEAEQGTATPVPERRMAPEEDNSLNAIRYLREQLKAEREKNRRLELELRRVRK